MTTSEEMRTTRLAVPHVRDIAPPQCSATRNEPKYVSPPPSIAFDEQRE